MVYCKSNYHFIRLGGVGMSEQEPQTRMKKNQKHRKKGGKIQIILGIVLIIIAAGLLAMDPIKNWMIERGVNQNTIANLTREDIEANMNADVTFNWDDIQTLDAFTVISDNVNPNHLPTIGGMAIPNVEMNLPIYKGVSNEGMYLGAGTLYPDQEMGVSNYSLASHHSINNSLLFAPLMRVEYGDLIYLTDLENVYVYEIDVITQVHPTDMTVVQPTEAPIITLITCDYSLNERVIVQGSLVEQVHIDDATDSMIEAFGLPQTVPGA